MSGIIGGSKTTNNQSSLINSSTDLVVNTVKTLSTTDAITTGPIVSSGGITSLSLNTGAIVSSGAITNTGDINNTGNINSSGNIKSTYLYSDRLSITNGGTTFTQSSLSLDTTNKFLNIWGYYTSDDIYNQRKIKLRDYVELKYLYATHGLAINTTPDNFTYKLNVNGNTNITGYIDISGNINNGSNSLTTGNITVNTGSISILPSSGISNLALDNCYIRREANNNITYYANGNTLHAFSTNNIIRMSIDGGGIGLSVPIYAGSNSVNCGAISCGGISSNNNFSNGANYIQTGRIFGNGNLYIGSNTVLEGGTSIWAANFYNNSDDRIKTNEVVITNATETLLKLRPETYDKYSNFDLTGDFRRDSGFVIQEVWTATPELRHLVSLPPDADIEKLETIQSTDPNNDPTYNSSTVNWGTTAGSLNYNGLIAFLVKSIQELNARITVLENP